MITEITPEQFATVTATGNIVVDFMGAACGNCKMLEPILVQLSKERPDYRFVKLNTANAIDIAKQYDVTTLPTLVIFRDGTVAEKIVGLKPKTILAKKL